MSDEQTPQPSEETNEQKGEDQITLMRARFEDLIAAATASNEKAKASENEAMETLRNINAIYDSAKASFKNISDAVPDFAAAQSEIQAKRAAVSTHAQQIDVDQKRVTDVRAELDGVLATVKQSQGEIDGLKQSSESAKDAASQASSEVQAAKIIVDANAKAVADALMESKTASATTKGLADKAAEIEERVNVYETKLNDLTAQCDDQLKAIKSLLPGATSAGLASAWDKRRQEFVEPSERWERIFFWSVIVLAAGGLASLIEFYLQPMPYKQALMVWLSRLPLAAALIWLALHASHNSALAKRLEEDYGFKASVASSFEGFREQMNKLTGLTAENEPLKTLCDATLTQITTPPGRIYEKHGLNASLASEIAKALREVMGTKSTPEEQ